MNLFVRQIIFAFVGLLCHSIPLDAYENFLPGSRFLALSECGTAIPDVWSVSQNQAGLTYLSHPAFALSSEHRYLMKELTVHSLAIAYPQHFGTFGTSINYYGFTKYHELKTGLAYALPLGQKLSVGIMLSYFSSFIEGASKNLNRITGEIGIMSNPIPLLTIGLHIFNPLPENTRKGQDATLPTTLRFGIAYKIRSIVTIATETQTGTSQKNDYKFGIEFYPITNLALELGLNTMPARLSCGINYLFKHFNFGIAFANHQILGTTTTVDLSYSIY